MRHEDLFRGKLYCTTCHQQPKEERRWNNESAVLIKNEDGTYSGYCMDHRPEKYFEKAELIQTCISVPWRWVAKITLHEVDINQDHYKGDIITVEMTDKPGRGSMQKESIHVCQALMLMADGRCTVHRWGERGEQNHCFVEPGYHWIQPTTCCIRDKYWGMEQIKNLHKVCRVMSQVHGWELVDETVGVLDRIAQALEENSEG